LLLLGGLSSTSAFVSMFSMTNKRALVQSGVE
jgi:hypothetical protein